MADLRAQFSLDFLAETGPLTKLEAIISRLDQMLERLGVTWNGTSEHINQLNKMLDAGSGVTGAASGCK